MTDSADREFDRMPQDQQGDAGAATDADDGLTPQQLAESKEYGRRSLYSRC